MAGLRKLAAAIRMIRDVRGKGLMIGVQFDIGETAEAVQWAALQRGLLVLEAGEDVVRMSPPLIVNDAEVDTCVCSSARPSPRSRQIRPRCSAKLIAGGRRDDVDG